MKARKLDLTTYEVEGNVVNPETGQAETKKAPYDMKGTLATFVLAPARQLNSIGLRKAGKVADKIEQAGDELLLSAEEHGELVAALDSLKGLGKSERILVDRVLDAPEVEMKEKDAGK